MSMSKLDVESEPYSRYGNMAADGIKRLLGAPHLDQLQTVIREAVQNSWDAGKGIPGTVKFAASIRNLDANERDTLESQIFGDMPLDTTVEANHPLQETIQNSEIAVLELSDFGTSGLGGPTRPDEVPDGEERPDFVDFMRNVGTPRDTEHGGGTYGYGKSSLYAISECQTVIVYTHTAYNGENVQRLMACRMGSRFDITSGDASARYTGRHWWGRNTDGSVEPISGQEARDLAGKLGMPARKEDEHGTTVMILAPLFGDKSLEEAGQKISESFLWHFWPKMIAEKDGAESPMEFSVCVSDNKVAVPAPEDCPPLNLFAKALQKVRNQDDSSDSIDSQRPNKHLGFLRIEKGIARKRREEHTQEGSLFPDISRHVALMRPAELVIKYIEGESLHQDGAEWAGVFICSEEDEVEKAFAASEPPAHDDWDPQFLPSVKGNYAKSYVNVALRKIKKAISEVNAAASPPPSADDDEVSIAEFADSIGTMLGSGQRIGTPSGPRPSPSPGKPVTVSPPEFLRHEIVNDIACAFFKMQVRTRAPSTVEISGSGRIAKDGGGADKADVHGTQASLLGWKIANQPMVDGEFLEIHVADSTDLEAFVAIPAGKAVKMSAIAEVQS